jgi:hypothetical protein
MKIDISNRLQVADAMEVNWISAKLENSFSYRIQQVVLRYRPKHNETQVDHKTKKRGRIDKGS